LGYLRIY